MNYKAALLVGATIGLVAAAGIGVTVAYGQRPDDPFANLRIAVVDVNRIRAEYEKTKVLYEQITKDADELRAELERRKKAIKGMDYELSQLPLNSKDYRTKQKELLRNTVEYGVTKKTEEIDLRLRDFQALRQVCQEIYNYVARLAKKKGIDLVLFKDDFDFDEKDERDPKLFIQRFNSRKVIYCGRQIDLTDEVLEGMNRAYKLGQFGK